uniref:YSIRK-type signal peptide-containing protein n=1 Tax=Streptococcus sp. 1453 TaxID=2582661 RepID=UPI001F04DCA0
MKLKSKEERKGEKVFRYSIRKYHFGAASVAVAALMFFANGTVQAQTPDISPATESGTTRTSDLVSDSSGGVSEELSEKTSDTDPSQSEQSSQGNQKPQEASDENKSLVKDSEEGKGEKQAEEASRPTVDKSLAESAQTSLQALFTNLTLDSMKELHARVEAGLAQAKAVLENPNSSQEEVNAQVQAMKTLTEEVNKALAGGLTSPAQLGEGSGATQSEPSPTPKRGRGRRGQLTPPATPAPAENQEAKETADEVTDYTNGQGSYPLSDK